MEERAAVEEAAAEVKGLEAQLTAAAEELRDSCAQLTVAAASLSVAAAENADKDAAVKHLKGELFALEVGLGPD